VSGPLSSVRPLNRTSHGVPLYRERQMFVRYLSAMGQTYSIEKRKPWGRRRALSTAVFLCGCSVTVNLYPMLHAAPLACERHRKALAPR
jgi:hypothetical protein